jgi:hypothetical protein
MGADHGKVDLGGTLHDGDTPKWEWSTTKRLEALKDVKIGQTVDIGNRCYGPGLGSHQSPFFNGPWRTAGYIPRFGDKSEFWIDWDNWKGESCSYSAGGAGANGHTVGGFHPRIKRRAYTADNTECCWRPNDKIIGERTCAPYNELNNCKDAITSKCTEEVNMDNYKCKDHWKKYEPSAMVENVMKYCMKSENIKGDFCRGVKKPFMDTIVQGWCQQSDNKSDPFCSCLNVPQKYQSIQNALKAKGQTLLPWCNFEECANNPSAYIPTYADKSCNQIICLQGIDLDNIGGSAGLTNISMNCEVEANGQNGVTPGLDPQLDSGGSGGSSGGSGGSGGSSGGSGGSNTNTDKTATDFTDFTDFTGLGINPIYLLGIAAFIFILFLLK